MPGNASDEDDYSFDIFVSYSRRGDTPVWVREHFVPALSHCLALELGREPEIFVDDALEAASTWPVELGRSLARSRVLVSLWTRMYLASDWCKLELSHMLARERSANCRSPARPNGMIAIPIIHDGETIPAELAMIQHFEIKDYFNPRMQKDSKRSEALYDAMAKHAVGIANLIAAAPEWSPAWPLDAASEFYDLFSRKVFSTQLAPPRYTQ